MSAPVIAAVVIVVFVVVTIATHIRPKAQKGKHRSDYQEVPLDNLFTYEK